MANSFRKDLVTGISKPNRIGLAAPIGIVPTSMHRHRPIVTRSPLMVEHKAMVDGLYVVVGRIIKGSVRQVDGLIKEGIRNVFAHTDMVARAWGFLNSHFPIPDFFVHVATVGRDHANKNVRGAT